MKTIDLDRMVEVLPGWAKDLSNVRSILLLSACNSEREIFQKLFPRATLSEADENLWNLDQRNEGHWDLIWAAFVFMCAAKPDTWIENMLESAPNLWIMDLVEGWRGGPGGIECATHDRDVMRYHLPGARASWPDAYDLGSRVDLHRHHVYPSEGPNNPRSFISWIRSEK